MMDRRPSCSPTDAEPVSTSPLRESRWGRLCSRRRLPGSCEEEPRERQSAKAEVFQVESDWIMDDSKYRGAFGDGVIPLEGAIRATLDWYRRRI
jgi:hypothetical protein